MKKQKQFFQKPMLSASPAKFTDMTIPQRFDITVVGNIVYAPVSWGSPNMTTFVNLHEFKKHEGEFEARKAAKKAHNKFLFNIFGTKRPTAGIIKRYYAEKYYAT